MGEGFIEGGVNPTLRISLISDFLLQDTENTFFASVIKIISGVFG